MVIRGIKNYLSGSAALPIGHNATRWAHIIVVVPDGRILLYRSLYNDGKVGSPWCATANATVQTREQILDIASMKLRTLFELDLKGMDLRHILSHSMSHKNMMLEVYRLKLQTTTMLHCSRKTEVASLSFKDLIIAIRKNENDFSETTKAAYNIISKGQALGGD